MKFIAFIFLLFLQFSAFSQKNDAAISFINATKSDNLIILGKIVSYPSNYDSTKVLCPEKITVEVIEIIKGEINGKYITIEGIDEINNNDHSLQCLYFYKIGHQYILALDNFKLLATGNHSLDYNNGSVTGNIKNEPDKNNRAKMKKLLDKLSKENLWENTNNTKVKNLREEIRKLSQSLEETMDYTLFKDTFF